MSFVIVKKELINRLSANITRLQEVYGYEVTTPNGWPIATIVRSDNENDFNTNTENMRTFAFRLTLREQLGQENNLSSIDDTVKERAERILDALTDEVIDYFDDRDNITLGGVIDFLEPIPSSGIYLQTPNGWERGAVIIIKAHKIKDIT